MLQLVEHLVRGIVLHFARFIDLFFPFFNLLLLLLMFYIFCYFLLMRMEKGLGAGIVLFCRYYP